MNARWQRAVVFGSWLALIAWLAWQWPRSPAHALAGWALAWVVYGLVQALPFVFMWRANRHEPVPRPRLAQLLHAWGAEALHACVVFGWRQPFCEHAEPDWLPEPPPQGQATRRGVVLLHGFLCNRGFWLPWMRLLRARGHAYVAPTLEPAFGSIDDYAAAIDAAVRRVAAATGMPPVIIGHSMGGLAARAWLRVYGGKRDEKTGAAGAGAAERRVHRIITLGSPHGGAWSARFTRAHNGAQMRIGNHWLAALRQHEPAGHAALFTCWYSNCDSVVFPASTATLPGADNRLVPGVAHLQMAFHAPLVQACLEELEELAA